MFKCPPTFCFLFLCLGLLVMACGQGQNHAAGSEHAYTNQLIHESSPYLLQHAHNPVQWFPWGNEALEKAQAENKLIVISIGYAACHWCHVMERESFEDTTVANAMNSSFVSIKIDREERPDIDQLYMDAANLLIGSGGWPLNVVALPDGRPVYAGTYFPKDKWLQLLSYLQDMHTNNPDRLVQQAKMVTEGIQNMEQLQPPGTPAPPDPAAVTQVAKTMIETIDMQLGGKKGAPKFPLPANYEFLLKHYYHSADSAALQAVNVTLTQMANGGIYDQLAGGFARYATDERWQVPHFEKMLYDNAQLVSLYTHAWQVTQNPLYKKVVHETLAFVQSAMTAPNGGFYSSFDADSQGEEGKYYVWRKAEVDSVLGPDAGLFCAYYNITEAGNWEDGKNILHNTRPLEAVAEELNITPAQASEALTQARQQLLQARATRVAPALDDKVLTAWNALMLTAYCQGYRAFGNAQYLTAAQNNAAFIEQYMIQDNFRLNRNFKAEQSVINAFLDDYSFTIEAFIALYQCTFDEQWLNKALKLAEYVHEHFYDTSTGLYFYTSSQDAPLIVRKKETTDNVIPASNSSLARGLFQLGNYFYRNDLKERATAMVNTVLAESTQYPNYYSNWLSLYTDMALPYYEVAIVGAEHAQQRQAIDQYYLPNTLLLGGATEGGLELLANKAIEGRTMIYVCREKACLLPVAQAAAAVKQIK